jgi:hypothetical protein
VGKKKTAERKNQNQIDLETIRRLGELHGVEVALLNQYPMHLRISGFKTFDYWPSTQRAWEYGTEMKSATKVSPAEVIDLVL